VVRGAGAANQIAVYSTSETLLHVIQCEHRGAGARARVTLPARRDRPTGGLFGLPVVLALVAILG